MSVNRHPLAQRVREARAAAHRPDSGDAFLPDSTEQFNSLVETEGESFAEEFIASALTGEPVEAEAQDEVVEEEWGGPFVELSIDDQEDLDPDSIPEPPPLDKLPPHLR